MKKTFFFLLITLLSLQANAQKKATEGWHLKDLSADGYYGISLDKAYQFLTEKKLKPKTVIVGVLDSGVDTTHEDLKPVLWHNPKEIPGNKKDDDKNGYTDDYYGWNFLGSADGQNVNENSSEWIRVYWRYKEMYEGKQIDTFTLSRYEKYDYALWQKARTGVVGVGVSQEKLDTLRNYLNTVLFCDSIVQLELKQKEYTLKELNSYEPSNKQTSAIKDFLTEVFDNFKIADVKNGFVREEIEKYVVSEERRANGDKIPPPNNRFDLTHNDETDPSTKFYGNNDVQAATALHGTHVSGIIGAVRNNKIGMDGIANKVKIMMVRTTPDGDEFDKDIAMSIRYAVDNGAKVISMSFGKSLSPDKKMIDDAVKYALSKDVLLVQGAGNSKRNINNFDNFPNPKYLFTDSIAPNYITVGASDCNGKAASFSNYGNKVVDIFAPGVAIYSTVPLRDKYMFLDGTSMATPVVSGVAALIRSYFPKLTAVQVKQILDQSVLKPIDKTIKPGSSEEVFFTELCKSGGIVNAYNAVKLAYEMSK